MHRRRRGSDCRLARLALLLPLALSAGAPAAAAPAKPSGRRPAAPALVSLAVSPTAVLLEGAGARQRLLVTGRYSDGSERDLTRGARFSAERPAVAAVRDGAAYPAGDGETRVVARVPGSALSAAVPVRVRQAARPFVPSFTRHVVPALNRYGCAAGACHGSFSGRGGLRLSLFGYDPEMDFRGLVRAGEGRRLNRLDPGSSLLLLKPTLARAHGGGRRFERDSEPYRLLAGWIAHGARLDAGPKLRALEIHPPERILLRGGRQQFLVTARYEDGSAADVTHLAKFGTNNEDIAAIDADGLAAARQVGDAALTAEFAGQIVTARVLVPANPSLSRAYPSQRTAGYVDDLVLEKLRKLGVLPSGLCSDVEFLRRVSLDLCGRTPTPEEIRAFAADTRPDRRARKIEELLQTEEYAEFWATFLCDVTGNDNRFLPTPREPIAHRWHRWFYARLRENTPWDRIARGVVAATSRDGMPVEEWIASTRKDVALRSARDGTQWDAGEYMKRRSLDFYWMKSGNDPATIGRQVSYMFLGVKLECAECHKHPFDRWSQADYQGFTAFFQRMGRGLSPETRAEIAAKKLDASGLNEVYFNAEAKGPPPRLLDGTTLPGDMPRDPREALADWMARPDNPYFAPSIVNRVWAHHLGRGIVDPPDAFSAANPPTNPRLLEALARDFIAHGFDLRHLHRTILNSHTYQRSWRSNATNADDTQNYSRYAVKQLPAEVMLDALNRATGAREDWGNFGPAGSRAIAIGSSRVGGMAGYVLKTFGRPTRSQSCDCERSAVPGLPQALYLINDAHAQGKIGHADGKLAALLKSGISDAALTGELYLSVLGRFPTAAETERAARHVAAAGKRETGFEDLMWALFNTAEFYTNH